MNADGRSFEGAEVRQLMLTQQMNEAEVHQEIYPPLHLRLCGSNCRF